jgi:MFS family permease
MTATPIAMLDCGHEFAAAAFVIQWHSLGMFAPSFVTGHLISRFGLTRIMLTGAVLLLLCSFINLSGLATLNFWAANVALGVGWNFLFVGATTLLTRTYAGAEKGKVQALNDFLVFGTVTLSSFASGAMLSGAGWIMVQIAVMPFVVVAGVAVLWWRHRDASATAMLRPAEPV